MAGRRALFSLSGNGRKSQQNYLRIIRPSDEVKNTGSWYKMNSYIDLQCHSCYLSPLVFSGSRRAVDYTTRQSVKY
jgi:hypothetical protein